MNKVLFYSQIKILSILTMVAFLLPAVKIGGFGMKLDLLFLIPLFFLIQVNDNTEKKNVLFRNLFILSFFIFISMYISNTLGNVNFNGIWELSFPTEFISLFSKIAVMFVFYFIGKRNVLDLKLFTNIISVVFLLALLFGFFQIIGLSLISRLSELYALSENQATGISSNNLRIYSSTGNILTWGGWSGFIFIYSLIIYKNLFIKTIMLILAFTNLLYTSSRGALIALCLSILFYFILRTLRERRFLLIFKFVFISGFFIIVLSWVSMFFFEDRIVFFIERFTFLNDAVFESGRNTQYKNISRLFLTDNWNYIFGIGKPVLDSIGLMETELFFLLFSYGLVGLILNYLFLFFVVKKAYFSIANDYSYVIIIGIFFYFIFSFGFFFLREIYAGLLFWSIIGYFLSKLKYEKVTKL